ncbi:MAG: hemin uptake protein HemP [Gammaproteobacteria bacterium]|jgi:hemin uptake protein HemP|nr:hemin uptake protein HemP [Pseudomonadota bacterium]QOJ21088.1 MAG: hemin uptake protein HemP [Gammaproteobacteria bacterium]
MNTTNLSQTIENNSYKSAASDIYARIDTDSLFKTSDVVLILHKGEQYSLRRTRNGKLILNK